jgi:hypothetical protein
MGAEHLSLSYASTVAQAANTSTSTRIVPGQGDYAAQKQVDKNHSAPPIIKGRKKLLKSCSETGLPK